MSNTAYAVPTETKKVAVENDLTETITVEDLAGLQALPVGTIIGCGGTQSETYTITEDGLALACGWQNPTEYTLGYASRDSYFLPAAVLNAVEVGLVSLYEADDSAIEVGDLVAYTGRLGSILKDALGTVVSISDYDSYPLKVEVESEEGETVTMPTHHTEVQKVRTEKVVTSYGLGVDAPAFVGDEDALDALPNKSVVIGVAPQANHPIVKVLDKWMKFNFLTGAAYDYDYTVRVLVRNDGVLVAYNPDDRA